MGQEVEDTVQMFKYLRSHGQVEVDSHQWLIYTPGKDVVSGVETHRSDAGLDIWTDAEWQIDGVDLEQCMQKAARR